MNYKSSENIYKNAVKKILDRMPKSLTDLEAARYIYVNLAKLYTFDENYWYSNSKIGKAIYKKAISSPNDINKLSFEKKQKALCVNINKSYNQILNSIGIKAIDQTSFYGDGHISTILQIGDKKYGCDLQQDLKFIQLNLPGHHFCQEGIDTVSESELKIIDNKIGFSNMGVKFEKFLLKKLKEQLYSYDKLGDKLNHIFKFTQKMPGVKNLSHSELQSLYSYFMNHSLDGSEIVRISNNVLYQNISPVQRGNYKILYSCYDDSAHSDIIRRFIYTDESREFTETTDEKIIELIKKENLHVFNGDKIKGLYKKNKKHEDKDK